MKIVSRLIATLTLVALTGSAFAQSVSVGSVVGQKGNQVVLEPTFTAGGQEVDAVQFLVTFANPALANFSDVTVSATCGGTLGTNNSCQVGPNKDAFQIIVSNGTNAMPTGTLASITFSIDGAAAAGDVALVVDQTSVVIGRNGAPANPPVPVSDGNIEITDGPQPLFAATPDSVVLSGQVATTLESDVVIDNSGGQALSMLDYTCVESADPDNKFTVSGDTALVIGTAATGTVTVACDSSAVGGPFTGTMECRHNGSNTSPAAIDFRCTVQAGPEPAYSDVIAPDPLLLAAVEEGDADPTGTVTVTNSGDPQTSLDGECTISGDAQISIANGAFTLAQNASQLATLTCDASAEGDYSAQVSCAHNGTNVQTPVLHDVRCTVGPPGPAIYASTPAPGATIDMTPPGDDVPAGTPVADSVLSISNAATDPNDRDLALMTCGFTGSVEITATAPGSLSLAPGASTDVTFSCDSAAAGAYTGTYSCSYDEDGDTVDDGPADYTVNCGVRAAAADILESPISGTALSILVPINGTGTTSVSFAEILDEGIDATIDTCAFATAVFGVVTVIPADVLAGGSTQVDVTGTDPGTGEISFTDTLTCTYTDTDSTPGTASWPITMSVLAQPIPTLSVWGLMLMILTLMGLGGMVIRSRVRS